MRTIGSLALAFGAIALGSVAKLAAPQGGGQQPSAAGRSSMTTGAVDTDEDAQPRTLPKLPAGMTTQMIVQGDSIFHGKGGCVTTGTLAGHGTPRSDIIRGTWENGLVVTFFRLRNCLPSK